MSGRFGRRRVLGYTLAGGAPAFALACGGDSKNETARQTAPAGTGTQAPAQAAAAEAPQQGGIHHWRITGTPPLDPFQNTSFRAQVQAGAVYSRLLRFKTGPKPEDAYSYDVEPDLAEAYELTPDGLQLTFKLRGGVAFHNLPPVNGRVAEAEDVKLALERFRTEPKNANRAVFGSEKNPIIDKVETPDARIFVVKLASPYASILNLFANPQYLWIMPREAGTGGFDPSKTQIGTGPFILESVQPDVEVKVRRNPSWFTTGQPYVDGVSFAIMAENVQEKAQFQAERLDVAAVVYEDREEVSKSNPKAQVLSYVPTTFPYLYMQSRQGPFQDERVRRAVSMSIDREAWLQLSWDGKGEWHSFLPASLGKWWLNPRSNEFGENAKYFKYDPKEARALLRAAGQEGITARLNYAVNGYGERYNQWAESVAGMIRESGMGIQLNPQDYQREYIAPNTGTLFGKFDGMALGLAAPFTDPYDYLFQYFHSSSGRNPAGVNEPKIDADIGKIAATPNETERLKLVKELQRYLAEKMYFTPGVVGPAYLFAQPWVRNLQYSPTYGYVAESFTKLWLTKR